MGKQEAIAGFKERISQIVTNIKSWTKYEWIFFFVIVPLFLYFVFLLPQNFKDSYLVLNTSEIFKVQTYILNEYTHSEFSHFIGNVKFYLIAIFVIFAFENDKKRFWTIIGCAFLLVPVIATFLTVIFWNLISRNAMSQGFSGITAALTAYALMVFLFWALHDIMLLFKPSTQIKGRQYIGYTIMCILVASILSMIISIGLQLGAFLDAGSAVSNGIAHFGGFITGLIVLLLYDLIPKNRNLNIDLIFGFSIIIGICFYIPYLMKLIQIIKNSVP